MTTIYVSFFVSYDVIEIDVYVSLKTLQMLYFDEY